MESLPLTLTVSWTYTLIFGHFKHKPGSKEQPSVFGVSRGNPFSYSWNNITTVTSLPQSYFFILISLLQDHLRKTQKFYKYINMIRKCSFQWSNDDINNKLYIYIYYFLSKFPKLLLKTVFSYIKVKQEILCTVNREWKPDTHWLECLSQVISVVHTKSLRSVEMCYAFPMDWMS